ncbi:MAG: FtsX-like permease family protein [Oscillospiraceae bacterium]|nr:FtsX-like permease family protein [Oscillospiraceae bacterium]
MKKNAMRKNLRQSILRSMGRYIAIVAIIALGASMFVGLLMTKSDMVATGQRFMDEQNMFDLRLLSSYGWNMDQVDAVSQMEGVVDAEGLIYLDVIVNSGDAEEESVYRFYSLPDKVNQVSLRGGRMPEAPNECLADGYHATEELLGTTVTVSSNNSEETLDAMVCDTYTVVGYVATPLYMDMNRGNTSVGSGSLDNYLYIPQSGFDVDYYTEINVTIAGDYDVYTDEYNDAMDAMADQLEPQLEPLAQERLTKVRKDAREAYADGLAEYEDGLQEYEDGKEEATHELVKAYHQLLDAQQEIEDNEQLLADGEKQIADARDLLKSSEKTLLESKQTLANSKAAAYKQISDATTGLLSQVEELTTNLTALQNDRTAQQTESIKLNTTVMQMETELTLLDSQISMTQSMISILDTSISSSTQALETAKQNGADAESIAEMEQEILDLQASRDEYTEKLTQQQAERAEAEEKLQPYYDQQAQLEQEQNALDDQISQLESAISSIMENVIAVTAGEAVLDAEFAAADAQIEAGEAQIDAGYLELEQREQDLIEGKAALEEGRKELEEGWAEYFEGRAEAEAELTDAEAELTAAKRKLDDAKETIDGMTENPVYVLDRTSNLGYNSLDSASDIVQGVSRVFPAFFLLIAALVCITTMTRMIDEERTQIGTLKALGYSNGAIISKYLMYAGSGAVVGCGLGVIVGSVVFPTILWEAYKIMLFITDRIVLRFNWWLCGAVVLAYTLVMLLVTWYCCRRTLEEVPAELIRPKSPEAGKKIFLEYLPFWHGISFLNKVTIRNIFRYRQRFAMMMVGIGGCTALLLTGFGLRDSIVNIVDYQFEEVTVYDMQVYFSEGLDEDGKEAFLTEVEGSASDVLFYHQESVEIEFDNQMREIYLMAADSDIQRFVDFHKGNEALEMPGANEVLLTVGVAEAIGIDVGDRVTMRSTDMEELELTVSAIYDNNVYNYAVVVPQTIEAQWGETPDDQMALVHVAEGEKPHEVSALIAGLDDVMNVSVSEDLAGMVGNMMDALDLVVWVIVFCAGLLAVIVLYNLTNININERIREIATIKVLGFNASETAAYIFKENLSLTVIGTIVGLPLGYLLLKFVMSQIKIDFCWFQARVTPVSYVLAVVLTLLSALVVFFIFYHKLERINMAEALKSVE